MDRSITGAVLDFRRDSGFMHRRAQARREAGELAEALELFRRASAAAPWEARYKLDVADALSQMGCARASYEQIVRMINEGELKLHPECRRMDGDALYLQARNMVQLGLNKAAAKYLKLAQCSSGVVCDEERYAQLRSRVIANRLLSDLKRLPMRTIARMERYDLAGDSGHAYALARRYLRHNKSPLAHAIMAWACALRDDQAASMEHLIKSLAMKPQDSWILAIAARVIAGADSAQAQPALQGAFALSEETECDLVLLNQAVALGMDSLVLDISRRVLACIPFEPRLCAHLAAAMLRLGLPARAALNSLRQCLNAYPDDPTALHYIELARNWQPGQPPPNYPDREMLELWARTVNRARARLISGEPAADDVELARILEWGLNFYDADVSVSSAVMLTHLNCEVAREALWRFLAAFKLPDSFRFRVLDTMISLNCPLPEVIFMRGKLRRLDSAAICSMWRYMEPRRWLRSVVRRLHRYPLAIASLQVMLSAADAHGGARLMASALELAFKLSHGKAVRPRACAQRRGLSHRQLIAAVSQLLAVSHTSGRHET